MKTEASIVNDQIVLAINIDLNKKELEKFFSLQKNGVIRRIGRDLQLSIWENFVAPNDIPGINISRMVGRNATQEDFDSIHKDAKRFMEWFAKQDVNKSNNNKPQKILKKWYAAQLVWATTLVALCNDMKEMLAEIEKYEKNEPEVPNDTQKALGRSNRERSAQVVPQARRYNYDLRSEHNRGSSKSPRERYI